MRRLRSVLIASLAVAAFGQDRVPQKGAQVARYVSDKYSFSVGVPTGWRVATGPDAGLPLFVNFRWSLMQAQLVLPKGGATIHILAEEDLPGPHAHYALDDWADFDQRGAVHDTATLRPFEIPPSAGVSRSIILSFDEKTYSPSVQQEHDVTVYWEFRGKRFATHLFYVVGDPKAKQYEGVLAEIMRSIRPL